MVQMETKHRTELVAVVTSLGFYPRDPLECLLLCRIQGEQSVSAGSPT